MISNASLLTILTFGKGSEEQIFFMYLKTLEEVAPGNIHWYKKKNNQPHYEILWEEKSLKQWQCIGTDSTIKELFNEIIRNSKTKIKIDKFEVLFSFNKTDSVIDEEELKEKLEIYFDIIDDISFYTLNNYEQIIGKEISYLLEPSTLNLIEGINNNLLSDKNYESSINSIKPVGLLPKNLLSSIIRNNIVALYGKRELFCDIKGTVPEFKDGKITNLKGFIQQIPSLRKEMSITVTSENGTSFSPDLDEYTGIWEISSNDVELGVGEIVIRNKTELLYKNKYALIRDFNVNFSIANTSYKDLYERNFTLSEKNSKTNIELKSISWDRQLFANDKISEIELSGKIKSVLNILSPKIVIFDPYGLGDIKNENNISKLTTKSQITFINSLITSYSENIVEEFILILNWARFKKFSTQTRNEVLSSYTSLFDNFRQFGMKSFELKFIENFHDRYWCSFSNLEDGKIIEKIYTTSTSLNGLFENRELFIGEIIGEEKTKKAKVLEERLNNLNL